MPHFWFKNYLADRKQTVQFKSEQSEKRHINCAVPQESILGPLLFILYQTNVFLYADDKVILSIGKNIAQIQKTMNNTDFSA